MRPFRLWHRVGPPTWKRSGTFVFSAVMGVLLIGGTAMAANLGLLTSTAPGDRGHRLEVPRPPLSVTLPTTEPAPPTVDSTSAPEGAEEPDGDADEENPHGVPAADGSTTDDTDDESGDTTEPASDSDDDDDSDTDDSDTDEADDSDDDDEPPSKRESDDLKRLRAESNERGRKVGAAGAAGDGSLDDD